MAFFGGEALESATLKDRLRRAVANLTGLLGAQRNLSFYTSFYKFIIILLPTAVVSGLLRLSAPTPSTLIPHCPPCPFFATPP